MSMNGRILDQAQEVPRGRPLGRQRPRPPWPASTLLSHSTIGAGRAVFVRHLSAAKRPNVPAGWERLPGGFSSILAVALAAVRRFLPRRRPRARVFPNCFLRALRASVVSPFFPET